MSERSTGWVVNDPDTGVPRNAQNAIAAEGRVFTSLNRAAFDTPEPAVATLEPPVATVPTAKPTRSRAKASTAATTELDMDDEAAVLEAIAKLATVADDPVYAHALQTIREAEATRATVRPAIQTALAGAGA